MEVSSGSAIIGLKNVTTRKPSIASNSKASSSRPPGLQAKGKLPLDERVSESPTQESPTPVVTSQPGASRYPEVRYDTDELGKAFRKELPRGGEAVYTPLQDENVIRTHNILEAWDEDYSSHLDKDLLEQLANDMQTAYPNTPWRVLY